ncbi:hypothetical protein K432DRAFT_290722 [Lepidopterella palustris CBS 459.81]|uniref:Uncharacterized protein n=1 Tax=Lepidopterella palustris CBS 459.81 TaxID=1314670 RepID=A0A8E2EGU3_9PEZI|nr:hypothetical protein K432DRAFT_290722 [Lepidopterella palustris CBS 459.81]
MTDAQKPFAFLHENIPVWYKNLTEIEEKVASKQDEIARVPVPVMPVLKKSGSTESIRPKDDIKSDAIGIICEEQEQQKQSTAARHYQLQIAKRKRKTTSLLSGHASGPTKYRSRTMIIVYYDSEVQKAFETLVRNIGTGRNLLRKGKMAARMEALAEMTSGNDDDDEGDDDPVLAKVGYRPRNGLPNFRSTRPRMGGGMGPTASEQFDIADKTLEKAQNLCERGAHQFLRDGDCRTELDGVRESLDEVLKLSETEVAKIKPAQKAEPVEIIQQTNVGQMLPKTMAIEVDDGDDDVDFALPPIRYTSRV